VLQLLVLAVVSLVAHGLLIRQAEARGWAGDERPGIQHCHRHWVTRLGGLALFGVLAGGMLLGAAGLPAAEALPWLVCLAPAYLAGLAEDMTGRMSAWSRLALTIGGAAVAWCLLDVQVVRFGVDAIDRVLAQAPLASLLLSAVLVGGIAHGVNIVDGCHGLAGIYALLTLLALGAVAGHVGAAPLAGVALAGAAVTTGFLFWNFPRGRIFLGDGGAYLLGTLIAFIAVRLVRDHAEVAPMFAALLLAYPAVETLFSMYRKRVLRRRSPLEPDAVHLHMLVHKRLTRTCRRGTTPAEHVLRNAMATVYLGPLLLGAALPATVLWRDAAGLSLGMALFVAAYLRWYAALARFGMPAWLRFPPAPWTWAMKRLSSRSAMRWMSNWRAMRSRPARPSLARNAGSRASASIAHASAAGSRAGTGRPAPPASSSGTPPTAVAITGNPEAIASISATGIPSQRLARTAPSTSRRR
jgi:UDP-GlcNAc:undecaprenyl-phosphate GlcNAc-1-phosphate transferase